MQTATPPATALASYSFRRSILEKERTYTLYPDRLEITGEDVPTRSVPLDQVQTVHLAYNRTKQRAYFQCFIHTTGDKVSLRHVHWGGIAVFQDRRETYTPFVRALLRALAQRPGVRFKAGSMVSFITAILGAPIMLGLGLLAVAMDLWAPAGLAALMLFICVSMLRRSRPRSVDPLNPPASLLPA